MLYILYLLNFKSVGVYILLYFSDSKNNHGSLLNFYLPGIDYTLFIKALYKLAIYEKEELLKEISWFFQVRGSG